MRIYLRAVNLPMDRETRRRVEGRLQAGLGRLADRIQRIGVRIVDQNGPRGGEDIACLVEVHLRSAGRLFVEATDSELLSAVNRAADKAAAAVVRTLERRRESRRRTRSAWIVDARAPRADPLFG